jgi:hypothetical protein
MDLTDIGILYNQEGEFILKKAIINIAYFEFDQLKYY